MRRSRSTPGTGYYGSDDAVRRALYIGDNLYTVSEARIKVNSLGTLSDVATVELLSAPSV